ncbi:hypothetical protein KEM48_010555 [Puccinia striiformis f. sp. tritici PST-130]|nr:hypothetical protein KEM48_010555 [Puccinia striiformis f. sp. tritici PST-130]
MADNPQTEQQRIRAIQDASAAMASKRGGLVLGAEQAHAIGISAALNKLKGIENLTDRNFISFRSALIDLEVPLIRQVIRPTEEELAINPNTHVLAPPAE